MGVTVRGTLALAGVLIVLVGYLWVSDAPSRRAGAAPEPALLAAPVAEVARVELADAAVRLAAVRAEGGWTDAAGRPWRSDAVSDLLDVLSTLRPVMVVDPAPEDPSSYGFGPDAPRLRLVAADNRPLLALEVGERNPPWTGLYARVAGRPEVLLVGAVLHWELEKVRHGAPEP
jgi:hypothetical protein